MAINEVMNTIDTRIAIRNLVLPDPPMPAGKYQAAVHNNGLLFLSGQFPFRNGKLVYQGQIGDALTIQDGRDAARLAALNVLSHLRKATHEWQEFGQLLRVEGYVSSAPGWFGQPEVLDGASEFFTDILGNQAGHARTAFSVSQLPLNAAVELVVIASLAGHLQTHLRLFV